MRFWSVLGTQPLVREADDWGDFQKIARAQLSSQARAASLPASRPNLLADPVPALSWPGRPLSGNLHQATWISDKHRQRPPRTGRQAAPECLCGERCVSCPGAACLQSRERRAEGWVQVPLNRRRGSQADPMASCQVSRADRRSIPVVMAQELFSPASISVAHTISLAPLDLSRGSAPAIAPPK